MRSAYPFISAPSGAIQTIQCKHCNTIMITIIRGKFTEIVCWGGMWCQWQCRCRCYSHMRFFVCIPFYLRIGNKSMLPLIFVCFHLWCRLCAFVVYDIERWHCSFAFFLLSASLTELSDSFCFVKNVLTYSVPFSPSIFKIYRAFNDQHFWLRGRPLLRSLTCDKKKTHRFSFSSHFFPIALKIDAQCSKWD